MFKKTKGYGKGGKKGGMRKMSKGGAAGGPKPKGMSRGGAASKGFRTGGAAKGYRK